MTRERVLKLPVLEIFGPTFQGEGRAIGQKTMFVRTAGCDYHCDWCDSAFTWDGSEKPTRMTADEVIEALDALGTYDYVTLSGGNPALLAANMAELVSKLKARDVTLAVETQGSIGIENELDKNAILEADAVILTNNIGIKNEERFKGKPVVRVSAGDCINKAGAIMAKLKEKFG